MPSVVVVVLRPFGDYDAGLGQAPDDVDVQALVADAEVERLDVAVMEIIGHATVRMTLGDLTALPERMRAPADSMENLAVQPTAVGLGHPRECLTLTALNHCCRDRIPILMYVRMSLAGYRFHATIDIGAWSITAHEA